MNNAKADELIAAINEMTAQMRVLSAQLIERRGEIRPSAPYQPYQTYPYPWIQPIISHQGAAAS